MKSLEKTLSKLAKKYLNWLFFLYCPELPKRSKQQELMFQNVAYRPTVNKTGIFPVEKSREQRG